MNAWAAATYLVKRGVPSRLAHERIGKAVQLCLERNCELHELPLEELQALSPAFGEDFYRVPDAGFCAGRPRCSGRHCAGRVRQAIGVCQEENRGSSRGGPCARVKQSCPMQDTFTN